MRYANARQKWRGSMNAWRRCVKDRLAVRRMCRLVLVSCALGLLVCTALSPGYGESTHEMKEKMHGNGFKGGGSSGGIKNNAVWMGNKNRIQTHEMIKAGNKNGTRKMGVVSMDGIGMNVHFNDHITNYVNNNGDRCRNCAHCSGCGSNKVKISTISSNGSYESSGHRDTKDSGDSHSSRGNHGAYDRSHGSFESNRSYKDNDSSKGHHRSRNESKIQRSDNKDRNKRNSHENKGMITVRHSGHHRIISVGYNKQDDNENKEINSAHHYGNRGTIGHNNHGDRNNSHVKGDASDNHSRSFLQGYGSRIWRFTSNNGRHSHAPSHRSSSNSYDSSHKGKSSHGDAHRNVIDETTTDAATTTDNEVPPDSYYDIKVL